MLIRVGFDMGYWLPEATPMVFMLNIHSSRRHDIVVPERIVTEPAFPMRHYTDLFGNSCIRVNPPAGEFRITGHAVVQDSGVPEVPPINAQETPISALPNEALTYLLPSRFCESDVLMQIAWNQFGHTKQGWERVDAISTFVNKHIAFDYNRAHPQKSALDAYNQGTGVCRDFAHLTIAFCRAMNIPARYVTGYMGDFQVPLRLPMDFSGWAEVFIGGAWHTVDARSNFPRIGRIVIGHGRDAADVALSTSFGRADLTRFTVWSDEITDETIADIPSELLIAA